MVNYLLIFRSLTQAQRAMHICRSAGIVGTLMRSPKGLSGEGCSHSLRLPESSYAAAIKQLRQNGTMPRKIFRADRGAYREVTP